MKRKKKLIPVIFLFTSLLAFELIYFFPKLFWTVIILFSLFTFLFVWKLNILPAKEKIKKGHFWLFWIPIFLFSINALIFGVFLQEKIYIHALALFTSFFSFIYIKYLFIYFRDPLLDDPKVIPNLSFYLNTISLFLISSNILSSLLLLNLNFFYLIIPFVITVFLLAYQTLWASHLPMIKSIIYSLVTALIFIELFWAFRYLSLSYYVVGFFLTVLFHLILSLSIFHLKDNWEFKIVRKYIILGLVLSLIVLISAQWR